jgi:hypothetical protein
MELQSFYEVGTKFLNIVWMTLIILTVKCSDIYEQIFQVTSVYVYENEVWA